MANRAPVIFFAFANTVDGRYLPKLAEEERRVREALDRAKKAGLCEVEVRGNATASTIWEVFLDPDFKGRIAVFHFGGHADAGEIVLQTLEAKAAGVHTSGLASFLGRQEGLQLVFLNGCSTEPQVQALKAAGVPAVIATSQAIDDRVAADLSGWFYKSLGAESPLGTAFENAVSYVRGQIGDQPDKASRSFIPPHAGVEAGWPWKLHADERATAWTLSGASGSPTTRQAKVEIPELLPYLCNREPQETPLDAAVVEHRGALPHRPLVVLIPGDYRQALDRFIDRLQDPTLPRFLGKEPLRRIGPLCFKDSGARGLEERLGPLERDLAEKLCGNRSAGLAAMAQAVAACNSPVMIDVVFTFEDGQPAPRPELVSAWLERLARWPDLPQNQPLIFLLRFAYRETAPPSPILFWKKRPSQRVAKLLDRVSAPAGLGLARLPPLDNVHHGEVLLWIEVHARAFACKEAGEDRDTLICDQLKERVRELFLAAPSFPMEELAPKLRLHLLQCLQQGEI